LSEDFASNPDSVWVSAGTLDNPEVVEMEYHYGVESQLPWVHFDDDLPHTRCDNDPNLINALSVAKNKET
jgi:hypothetical protein